MSLDGNIPYGSVNPFGKPQPQAMTFGDLYNQSTGYYGTPFTGQMPNAGSQGQSFNFTQPSNPITSSSNLSSSGESQSGNPMAATSSAMNPLQTVLGAVQLVGGVMGNKQLQKEAYPSFKPITQLQQAKIRSGQLAQMGYTPEQTAVFKQDLARIGNEDYRNAISLSGGSLSRALNARRNTMRFGALNQFAQGDAAQRLSNIRYDDSITGQLQNLANMETQNRLQRRISLEQAYGGAIKAGTENIVNSYDSGQALKMISGVA
jgi:hypothetical protein